MFQKQQYQNYSFTSQGCIIDYEEYILYDDNRLLTTALCFLFSLLSYIRTLLKTGNMQCININVGGKIVLTFPPGHLISLKYGIRSIRSRAGNEGPHEAS